MGQPGGTETTADQGRADVADDGFDWGLGTLEN
jgi:hypothetical protein